MKRAICAPSCEVWNERRTFQSWTFCCLCKTLITCSHFLLSTNHVYCCRYLQYTSGWALAMYRQMGINAFESHLCCFSNEVFIHLSETIASCNVTQNCIRIWQEGLMQHLVFGFCRMSGPLKKPDPQNCTYDTDRDCLSHTASFFAAQQQPSYCVSHCCVTLQGLVSKWGLHILSCSEYTLFCIFGPRSLDLMVMDDKIVHCVEAKWFWM